uniref:Uncharacterized protein n=1 Tax=Oreochromis aureus TaxID=47969 RepID=A0AAZ1XKT8_OREAU
MLQSIARSIAKLAEESLALSSVQSPIPPLLSSQPLFQSPSFHPRRLQQLHPRRQLQQLRPRRRPLQPLHPRPLQPLHPRPLQPLHPRPLQPLHPRPLQPLHPRPLQPLHPRPLQPLHPRPLQPLHPRPLQPLHPRPSVCSPACCRFVCVTPCQSALLCSSVSCFSLCLSASHPVRMFSGLLFSFPSLGL